MDLDGLEWKLVEPSRRGTPAPRASYALEVPYLRILGSSARADAYSGDGSVAFSLDELGTAEDPAYRFSIDLLPDSDFGNEASCVTYSPASGSVSGIERDNRTLFQGYTAVLGVPGLSACARDMPGFIQAIAEAAARYGHKGEREEKRARKPTSS